MKSILFDHQVYSLQDRGGISRYFSELLRHYKSDRDIDARLGLKYTENIYTLGPGRIVDLDVRSGGIVSQMPFIRIILNNLYCLMLMRRTKFHLFHPTYYLPYFLPALGQKPFVLTIFDMIHELMPGDFPIWDRTQKYKALLASKANKVIAISEQTKKDIVKIYGIESNRIKIIGLGSSLQKYSSGIQVKRPPSFLLYIGRRGGYKNFNVVLSALVELNKEFHDLRLVCIGGGGFARFERSCLQRLGLENKVQQMQTSDNCLAELYRNAKALVVPSLYEGFGLPAVEAMALGCPMVLSDIPIFHEVAGDTANYFDPHESHSLVIAIKEILTKHEKRKWLVNKALERSEYYQWKKTAEETKDLYLSVINDKIKK